MSEFVDAHHHIWRQADSARLSAVLDTMLAHGVTWDPTFAIYEANRDLQRARNARRWMADRPA